MERNISWCGLHNINIQGQVIAPAIVVVALRAPTHPTPYRPNAWSDAPRLDSRLSGSWCIDPAPARLSCGLYTGDDRQCAHRCECW
jgi:hypothetical protein